MKKNSAKSKAFAKAVAITAIGFSIGGVIAVGEAVEKEYTALHNKGHHEVSTKNVVKAGQSPATRFPSK